MAWTAAFAALASLLAIAALCGTDNAFVTFNRIGVHATQPLPEALIHLGVLQSVRRAVRRALASGIRSSTASRILLCSSTIRFERAERLDHAKRRQNAMRSAAEVGMVIAPSPAIYSWRALPPLRGESESRLTCSPVGSFAEANEHRVVAITLSPIIRLCEKPRHYNGEGRHFARSQLIQETQDGPPASSRSALSSGSGAASQPRTVGFEDGGPSLPLGFRASSSRRSSQLFSARRAGDRFCAQLCRSWRKPVGSQRVDLICSGVPSGNGLYCANLPYDQDSEIAENEAEVGNLLTAYVLKVPAAACLAARRCLRLQWMGEAAHVSSTAYLKLLRGNPGKRKLNKHEPQPAIPARPAAVSREFLDGYAREEWEQVSGESCSTAV